MLFPSLCFAHLVCVYALFVLCVYALFVLCVIFYSWSVVMCIFYTLQTRCACISSFPLSVFLLCIFTKFFTHPSSNIRLPLTCVVVSDSLSLSLSLSYSLSFSFSLTLSLSLFLSHSLSLSLSLSHSLALSLSHSLSLSSAISLLLSLPIYHRDPRFATVHKWDQIVHQHQIPLD